MNRTASARWVSPGAADRRSGFLPLLVVGGLLTTVATVADSGAITFAIAPILAVAALGLLCVAPLRVPLFVFMFLGLGIDATGEGSWNSPLAPLGHLFTHNLNQMVPIAALALPLLGICLLFLFVVQINRRVTGSHVDGMDRAGAISPMNWAIGVSLLAMLAECANGYRYGGDMQMAKNQLQFYIMALLMAYLLIDSLRGVRDYRTVGAVIVAAACSKALIVLYIYRTIVPHPVVATTHGDSILFAGAATILMARFAEHPGRRNLMFVVALLPLLVGAMVANNRRLAWVELVAGVVVVQFLGRMTRIRRLLLAAAVPLLLAYVAIGWNSNSSVFAPVRSLRTVGNADLDPSTMFRDLENFNLLATMRIQPIIGLGFGQRFAEPVTTPDISFFREYRYLPHNSVLGLWGFTGWLGFTGLFTAVVVGVFLAARGYRFARSPDERAAGLAAIGVIVIYLIQCWGDIGFSEKEAIHMLGPALAVAGHLAVSTGGWTPPRGAGVSGRPI